MFCTECTYDLRGCVSQRCPECGKPFDRDDTSTYSASPIRMARRRTAILLLGMSYPWWIVASLFMTWFAAIFTLGRVPRPYADDPKSIGLVVSALHDATVLLILGSPVGILGGVAAILFYLRWTRAGAPDYFRELFFLWMSWLFAFSVVSCGSRGSIGAWIMD